MPSSPRTEPCRRKPSERYGEESVSFIVLSSCTFNLNSHKGFARGITASRANSPLAGPIHCRDPGPPNRLKTLPEARLGLSSRASPTFSLALGTRHKAKRLWSTVSFPFLVTLSPGFSRGECIPPSSLPTLDTVNSKKQRVSASLVKWRLISLFFSDVLRRPVGELMIPHSLMGKVWCPILAGCHYLTFCGTCCPEPEKAACCSFAAWIFFLDFFLVAHQLTCSGWQKVVAGTGCVSRCTTAPANRPSPSLQLPDGLPTCFPQQGRRNFRVLCRDRQSKDGCFMAI